MGDIDFLQTDSGGKSSKRSSFNIDYTDPEKDKAAHKLGMKPLEPKQKKKRKKKEKKLSWWQLRKLKKAEKKKKKEEEKQKKQEEKEKLKQAKAAQKSTKKEEKKLTKEEKHEQQVDDQEIELLQPEMKARQDALTGAGVFKVPEVPDTPPEPKKKPEKKHHPKPVSAPLPPPEFLEKLKLEESTPAPPPAPNAPLAPPQLLKAEPEVKKEKPKKDKQHKAKKEKKKKVKLSKEELKKIKNGELSLAGIDVNLLPKKLAKKIIPASRWKSLSMIALVTVVLVALAYGGMLGVQYYFLQQTKDVQQDIATIDEVINGYAEVQSEVVVINEKIEGAKWVLERHIYWSAFFKELEKYTLPQVEYTSFSGDVAGALSLQARAETYQNVTQQVAVFKQADHFINDVTVEAAVGEVSSAAEGEDKPVKFAISLQINPLLLYQANQEDAAE